MVPTGEINRNGVESVEKYLARAKAFWSFLKVGRSSRTGDISRKDVYNNTFYENLDSIIQEYLDISQDNTQAQISFILKTQSKYKLFEEPKHRESPTKDTSFPVSSPSKVPFTQSADKSPAEIRNFKVKGLRAIQNFIAKLNCIDKMHITLVEEQDTQRSKMLSNSIDIMSTCLTFCYQDNPIYQWQKVVSLTIKGPTHVMEVVH